MGLRGPEPAPVRLAELIATLSLSADLGQGLLAWVGCTADSHETAAMFRDDMELRGRVTTSPSARPRCSDT